MATGSDASSRYDRSKSDVIAAERQIRVAWITLLAAFVLFVGTTVGASYGVRWVIQNATEPETAILRLADGADVRVNRPGEFDSRIVRNTSTIREGDVIATTASSTATLEFFDGSAIELMDDTTVRITRIRSSRFLKRTRLVEIDLRDGLVYATLRPTNDYTVSELIVRTSNTAVSIEASASPGNDQRMLVEVLEVGSNQLAARPIRVASLDGVVGVESADQRVVTELATGEQTIVRRNGEIGAVSRTIREIVINGDYSSDLERWETIGGGSSAPGSGRVAVVNPGAGAPATTALVLRPADEGPAGRGVGVQQTVGRLLGKHGRLTIGLELIIEPVGRTAPLVQPPLLTISITYLDTLGEENEWTRRVSLTGAEMPKESDDREITQGFARIETGEWRRIMFDLGQAESSVRQITSIVVYASGKDYQMTVTNISLTALEIVG